MKVPKIPNRARNGAESIPARVVAPISVNGGSGKWTGFNVCRAIVKLYKGFDEALKSSIIAVVIFVILLKVKLETRFNMSVSDQPFPV